MKKVQIMVIIFFVCLSVYFGDQATRLKEKNLNLENENEQLEKEIDDILNGDERLCKEMNISYGEKNYDKCIDIYNTMKEKHQTSEYFNEVENLYNEIIVIKKNEYLEEEIRLAKEEVERKAEIERAEKEKEERELKRKEERERSLTILSKKLDDVSGITWYNQKHFFHYNNKNLVSLYLGDKNSQQWLILKMSYEGDDWIFFEKAYLSYDGNTLEIPFDRYDDKKSDHNGAGVWEWIQISPSDNVISFIRRMVNGNRIKVRFSGKYTETRELTWVEIQGLKDVLNGYDALNEQ